MSASGQELLSTIEKLLSDSRGILAADESFGTIGKRFAKVNVESTPESRREYRELLFTTPGVEQYISGVILFDETIRQRTSDGKSMTEYLGNKGMVPGIKVDKGTTTLSQYPSEKITEGLDGLQKRCTEYKDLGAKFAKWRAVFTIGPTSPSRFSIDANALFLSRYAAICQDTGLVPIVEPEVLMDGQHDISLCEDITTAVLQSVFYHLFRHKVSLEGIVLKPNMILNGKENMQKVSAEEVAQRTIRTLRRTVPAAVPAIAFLSGGQTPLDATRHLQAINQSGPQPWVLTFSFSRALQELPLNEWRGMRANIVPAQRLFLHRSRCNSAARSGKYNEELESQLD